MNSSIKPLFYKAINKVLAISLILFVVSCSSNGSQEWPKMEADDLWSDLETARNQQSPDTENVADQDVPSNPSSVPPGANVISDLDITVTLEEIERDLPVHIENMALARDRYDAATADDRELHWRGVEIEISRLNEMIGKLREIDYQLTLMNDQSEKKRRAKDLLTRISDIIPDTPSSF